MASASEPIDDPDGPTGANTTVDGYIRFPPFPTPSPGVEIVPFTQFKPSGVQINVESVADAEELDGLGMPTVTLRARHEMDRKKRKKAAPTVVQPNGVVRKLYWFEQWAEGEDLRKSIVDL